MGGIYRFVRNGGDAMAIRDRINEFEPFRSWAMAKSLGAVDKEKDQN